jgi:SLOG in TRPM, prokaryote
MLTSMPDSVRAIATLAELIEILGPAPEDGRAVVLVGGADFTEPELVGGLRAFFASLADHLERTGTAVVDGGTDSGVMRLIAEARDAIAGDFPLIGVAPALAFSRPTRTGTPIEVAGGHSVVVLVPGSRFGEETPWLFAAADHLGGGSAPTLIVNGGSLAFDEARQRLIAGHAVIAVAGSGRAADELATDEGLRASGRLRVIPLTADEAAIAAALERGMDR